MIYYLGDLVECGEFNVRHSVGVDGWLQLSGEEQLIRFELDSRTSLALGGCRLKFAHSHPVDFSDEPLLPNLTILDSIEPLQQGRLVTLKLSDVVPDDFDSEQVRVRRANSYRGRLQLVWESPDGLMDVSIMDCEMDVFWKNSASQREEDLDLPEVVNGVPNSGSPSISMTVQDSVTQQLPHASMFDQQDNHAGEYLLSMCMPSNQDLESRPDLQLQTMLHRVEDSSMDRLVEFMEEISQREKNIPIYELIEPPIQTPRLEEMSSELLKSKLTEITERLQNVGIEFTACDHFDAAHTYDWLVNRIIAWEQVHPHLNQFKMRRCFNTASWCDRCRTDE